MTSREDIELYMMGNFDGDVAALERAIVDDPALGAIAAGEARFELLLREAAAAATFCPACGDLVREERCDSCGAAMRPGGYTVERVLVSNAHGRMYVAHDADGKQVALKELAFVHAPSLDAIAAFEREAKFLRALEHPAIPRFLASFEEGHGVHTRYYLAQELVVGEALDHLDDHWYTEAEIVALAKQVLEILVYLQSLSPMVIHRDVKPANLLRRADGSIALVDFGAAHVQGTTAGSTTIGTFGYMPIEQLAGLVDATTDVYALGATLLHLLTRQEPWRLAQNRTTLNVSAPLRAFFDKMIAPDARDRFASAKAALVALDQRDQLVVRKPRRWRAAAVGAASIAAVVLGSGVAVLSLGHHAALPPDPSRMPTLTPQFATIGVELPVGVERELMIDGKRIGTFKNGAMVPVLAGRHQIAFLGPDGPPCAATIELEAGKTVRPEVVVLGPNLCVVSLHGREEHNSLPHGKLIDLQFKAAPMHDMLRFLAAACDVNMVVPDYIDGTVTEDLKQVPCDQEIEVLLESHGLWYDYQSDTKLLRVAPRKELDGEAEARVIRAKERGEHWVADDILPAGNTVDLDFKLVPLRAVLNAIAAGGGSTTNLVIPDTIGNASVSIVAKGVPWDRALQSVLASHGLWYRYRDNGKIIRIAPRKELDGEDEAALIRSRQ
ncbi:MAG: serine/threonine protein kinase [Myxococcales bacterium]|nr:serine/threonine protein kinase [Myxococcales bacterium]